MRNLDGVHSLCTLRHTGDNCVGAACRPPLCRKKKTRGRRQRSGEQPNPFPPSLALNFYESGAAETSCVLLILAGRKYGDAFGRLPLLQNFGHSCGLKTARLVNSRWNPIHRDG